MNGQKSCIMKKLSLFCSLLLFIACAQQKNLETGSNLVILGTIHSEAENVTAASIYEVLKNYQPDIILLEVEPNLFEKENVLKTDFDGVSNNEFKATLKYQKEHPNVQLKPAELDGKNNYRRKLGIYAEADFVVSKLNELLENNKLSAKEKRICDDYEKYWYKVDTISKQNLKTINSNKSDFVIDSLMNYQYSKMNEILKNHSEFSKAKILNSTKSDSISYAKYYKKWSDFEGTIRNEGIAKNVVKYQKENPNKKIILLVGFKHRFYVKKYLKNQNIKTAEYYE